MPKTLLLADDSVVIQKLVGLSFANEDVELVTVDNGDDAIARARELGPDLVLADVVMPGKSGYEVCEAIKSDPQRGHTPVLLLTGTFEAFDEARAQAAGANGHITKPFEAQALVERVNELLARAAHPISASPAPETADFFDENLAATGTSDPLSSQQSPVAPAAPESDFAFGGEPTPSFEPLGPFESSGLGDLDLPPAPARSEGGLNNPGAPLAGAGGDETIAIMPGAEDDPQANTADMPNSPIGMSEYPSPIDADLGSTVLADESFGTPPLSASEPQPPIDIDGPGFDSHENSYDNRNTAPHAFTAEDLEAPPAPEVPLPPASPQPPPLPGTSDLSDSAMDLDDLSFRTQPASSADPAETLLADDLFAGAPSLSERPPVDLDAAPSPGSSGLDVDFDAPNPGGAGPAPFVPDNAGDYDVSSSDLGPPPLVSAPEWDAPPAPPELGSANPETVPASPVPRETTPNAVPDSQVGAPQAVQNDDWLIGEEPITKVDALGANRSEQPAAPPAPAAAPAQDAGTSSALVAGKPDLSPMMRDRVHDTLEKVAWEAFSDLSETVVQQILKRVEEVAWEVIPQMTEALVREEIRRMKAEEES
ncbi:MAG: response regulator [Deltaproteobacteria bacterium]|nr:response regulator [Deltaproteobacteria bacterium]MBW2417719.1 response regulator [Deltaproteobacteria bacterium]